MPELPARAPRRTDETAPFWDACAQGRLVVPRCTACSELIWYPRRTCPTCGNSGVEWIETRGVGEVYSYSIIRKGSGPFRDAGPYVLAIVELSEGLRLMTNIVIDDPERVTVGMPVKVRFQPAGDAGDSVPRFEPA